MQLAQDVGAPAYQAFVARLSRASVTKHFDAYEDVDWDAPENRIDPEDPRFILDEGDALGATDWYKTLPGATRARLGLHFAVCQFRIGMEFERVLQKGLLELADRFQEGSPELRYCYHEVIEESQHSLMFQEIIHRSGLEPYGMEGIVKLASRRVPKLARRRPELFFLHVLAGEVPIDLEQKRKLAQKDGHPLIRRVMQIHVTEEARHVAFARAWLKEHVPHISWFDRWFLRIETPLMLEQTARSMLEPPRRLIERFRIPEPVLRAAYADNPAHKARIAASVAPIRDLSEELGIITPLTARLWRRLGLWA